MKETSDIVPFDQEIFENKIHDQYLGYQGELQRNTDKKTELFIQLNYFQSCLEDSMEYLLKTEAARKIKQEIIIKILFTRGIITTKQAKIANKINDVRNVFAHNFHNPAVESMAKEKIDKIKIDFTEGYVTFDNPYHPTPEQMQEHYEKYDMYQKLDYIC